MTAAHVLWNVWVFNKNFYKPFNHFTIMIIIIATDIHVKIIENGIINIKDYPAAELDSVQYEREPARKFTREQAKALGLIK